MPMFSGIKLDRFIEQPESSISNLERRRNSSSLVVKIIEQNQIPSSIYKTSESNLKRVEKGMVDNNNKEISSMVNEVGGNISDKGFNEIRDLGDDGLGVGSEFNDLERKIDSEIFFDPRDSLSYTDDDGEECSFKLTTPTGEYLDPNEELSSGCSRTLQDYEKELRGIRLNLLMEIEKRKEGEDALNNMQRQWERLRELLSVVGVKLPPAASLIVAEGDLDSDPAEDVCQQIKVATSVANSEGRAAGKAEAEMEMESRMEEKNFEIARLSGRLNYYETVTREMSQCNLEAVEMARDERQKKKKRERWIWSSIGSTIALGSAALAWSYRPTSEGSLTSETTHGYENGDTPKPQNRRTPKPQGFS